jgi:hypothetical protein
MTRPLYRGAVASALLLASVTASGQSLADRVERVREGDVRFTFPLRPDVCGYGQSIWRNGSRSQTNWGDRRNQRDVEYDVGCDSGPGRVVITRRDGETADLRFYVGGRWRSSATATDLGMAGARAAADFLTGLAATHDGKPGRDAIFPATLVDSVVIWPALMRIARDDRRPRQTREGSVFWLGQLAGEATTAGLDSLVRDDTLDRKVRESAIFALSQRPDREGVPALIRVVRTSTDPALRRSALFWLANSKDPRALDLIEELLTRR